jgi:hypothetical protein
MMLIYKNILRARKNRSISLDKVIAVLDYLNRLKEIY